MRGFRAILFASLGTLLVPLSAARTETKVELKAVHLCCFACTAAVESTLRKIDEVNGSCDQAKKTVTIVALDDSTAQKAPDALAARGFHGDTPSAASDNTRPDPVKLLRQVEEARLGIASGRLVMSAARTLTAPPKHGTDKITLKIVFDGRNRRFEQRCRELSNFGGTDPDGGRAREKKFEALGGDREEFVRLGLGYWQDNYYCTAYDGARLLQYTNENGGRGVATIDVPNRVTNEYVFDPRTLGIDTSFAISKTVAASLGDRNANAVTLIEDAKPASAATWHVRVVNKKYDIQFDFWIDRKCPSHVIRFEETQPRSREVAISHYDEGCHENSLPRLVEIDRFLNGKLWVRLTLNVTKAEYNIPIDPTSWALAGLNLPIGTSVVDVRIHRRIGYWDGNGVSKDPPSGAKRLESRAASPNSGKLLKLAKEEPQSALALTAVASIIANTPDGPDVDAATDLLIREHIHNKDLGVLCEQLTDRPSPAADRLLRAVVQNNPHPAPRVYASFSLGMHLKEKLTDPDLTAAQRASLTRETQELFERVVSEHVKVPDQPGRRLGRAAQRELDELTKLQIGMQAPEIEGPDADGKNFKLSDYRGKVVLLCFSASWCDPCVAMYPQKRALLERYARQPFAVLDVNADTKLETLQESTKEGKVTWRCWWEGSTGKISQTWNVAGWPTVYLIDSQGVVRFKNVRGTKLDEATQRLMSEGTAPPSAINRDAK